MKTIALTLINRDAPASAGRERPMAAYQTSTGTMFVTGGAVDAQRGQQFTVHRQWANGAITLAGPRSGFTTREQALAFIQQKDQDGFI